MTSVECRRWITGTTLCVLILLGGRGLATAQPAPDANSILILSKSVRDNPQSIEATEAASLGYTVVTATDAQWGAMGTSDFASYKAIVLGDGMCQGGASLAAAEANRDVWGSAISGNVIVVGTHPQASTATMPGAHALVNAGLRFAAGGAGTGAYITPGCYLSPVPVAVAVLEPFGAITAVRQDACPVQADVVTADATLGGLAADQLSGWKCTADSQFAQWPSDFQVAVMATNAATMPYFAPDGTEGSPYILIRPGGGSAGMLPSANMPLLAPGDPTATIALDVTGEHDFLDQSFENPNLDLLGTSHDVGGGVKFFATWSPASKGNLSWNSNNLRQGETPGMSDDLDPGHGTLKLAATANFHFDSINISDTESLEGDCVLQLSDKGQYECKVPVSCFTIPGACIGIGLVNVCACLSLTLDANITPADFTVDRTVYYGATAGTGPDTLTFPPDPQDDPFKVSCYVPEGTEAVYELANPATSPDVGFAVGIGIGFQECDIATGCHDPFASVDVYTTPNVTDFTLPLSGNGGQASLGTVLKDVTPPDLSKVQVAYSGNEGSPIQFTAAATTDSCIETVSYTWNFSDHGVEFGISPLHTFPDNATWSGQLQATDLAGNAATKDLTISVANVAPVVHAGPNLAAAWGVPVAFNGSATDPGSADQSTLAYAWSFGDGSPSATGGPSVTHAYSSPGSYQATLQVCDKDGACSSSTTSVTVRKRNVTVGYLGDQNGVYNTLTTLKGSITDELGAFVQGRTLSFAIGAEAGGAAASNSVGVASTSHLLGLAAGNYMVSASFAGDALYNGPVTASGAYVVAKKPTSVTYTGALTGGPNKVITLSATLVDGTGTVLAGRTVAFQLGTQAASAVTNTNGIATTSLQLNQKNGTYSLTATYSPSGADAGLYVGSAASATFKLQSK